MFLKSVLSYIAVLLWCTDYHYGELKKNSYELFREVSKKIVMSCFENSVTWQPTVHDC